MAGALKLEHVALSTDTLGEMVEFYTSVLGMVHLGEADGTTYLGCGVNDRFDLALRSGPTSLDHFAIRLADPDEVDGCERRLESAGIAVERTDGDEPAQDHGVRFRLPSGIPIELVATNHEGYPHAADAYGGDRESLAPLGLHHLNLVSPAIREDADVLTDLVEFAVSEVRGTPDDWETAFLRRGEMHHDVGLIGVDPGEGEAGLHHIALAMRDANHLVQFVDKVTQDEVELEFGIGRHDAGDNLFAYFWAPGGHRLELAAEMASVDADEPVFTDPPTSTWSTHVPASFYERGSGLAE